jgi:hypothetical protein
MTDILSKTFKQIEIASNRYKKDGVVWTVQIMQKMVENAQDYDADVIEYIKGRLEKWDK